MSKEGANKRSSVALKSNPAFKIKNKATNSLGGKGFQTKSPLQKTQKPTKQFPQADSLTQLLNQSKIKADGFFSEWKNSNDDFQTRKIRVMAWTGEQVILDEVTREMLQMKENYNLLQRESRNRQNESRSIVQTNVEYPVYGAVVPKLELKWELDSCDKAHLKSLKLKKFIACVGKVMSRYRAGKRLILIKNLLAERKKASEKTSFFVSSLKDPIYKGSAGEEFILNLDETTLANDELAVQTDMNFKKICLIVNETPIVWTDELLPLTNIPTNFVEVNDYKPKDMCRIESFIPMTLKVDQMKSGAYDELGFTRLDN